MGIGRILRYTFSLKLLFAVVCVIAIGLGLVVRRRAELQSEYEAITKLRAVEYRDWKRPSDWTSSAFPAWTVLNVDDQGASSKFPEPVTVRNALEFWQPPVRVQLESVGHKMTDDELRLCNSLRHLVILRLSDVNLTDRQFELITAVGHLERLELDGNPLHDDSVRLIGQMRGLTYLVLGGTKISDSGMHFLAGLQALKDLQLFDTAITDSGIQQLANCQNILYLSLGGTGITDEALKHLAKLSHLSALSLIGTRITDDGVRHLLQSKSRATIVQIDLSGTQVTDEVIPILNEFTALQLVGLEASQVDPEKAAEFQNTISARNSLRN